MKVKSIFFASLLFLPIVSFAFPFGQEQKEEQAISANIEITNAHDYYFYKSTMANQEKTNSTNVYGGTVKFLPTLDSIVTLLYTKVPSGFGCQYILLHQKGIWTSVNEMPLNTSIDAFDSIKALCYKKDEAPVNFIFKLKKDN